MSRAAYARATVALTAIASVANTGCGDGDADRVLTVHSPLPAAVVEHAEAAYEAAHPDVDVRIVAARTEETLAALRAGEPVDVWWGAPVLDLEAATDEGLLATWSATLQSPFVIAFDRERIPLAEAPTDWVDLFHHVLWGEVLQLDPRANPEAEYFIGAMLVEALRDDDDLQRGFDWHGRLDRSTAAYVADADELVRRLRAEEGRYAILPRHVAEEARHGSAPWLYYRIPTSGTPVLALGVGVAAGEAEPGEAAEAPPASDAGLAFLKIVGSPGVLTVARLHTRWAPVEGEVDRSAFPADFELGERVSGYPLAADTLAHELERWVGRWELDVRGRGGR